MTQKRLPLNSPNARRCGGWNDVPFFNRNAAAREAVVSEPLTPTRIMAQSAAQKAQDAYAGARNATDRLVALEARVGQLEDENAELQAWRRATDRLMEELKGDREEARRPVKRKAA